MCRPQTLLVLGSSCHVLKVYRLPSMQLVAAIWRGDSCRSCSETLSLPQHSRLTSPPYTHILRTVSQWKSMKHTCTHVGLHINTLRGINQQCKGSCRASEGSCVCQTSRDTSSRTAVQPSSPSPHKASRVPAHSRHASLSLFQQ